MQVFVLGMHRSGTSVLARILNLMGFFFGSENVSTGRNAENEKGFWERRDVRTLNDTVLFTAGCDWDRVSELDLDAIPASSKAAHRSAAADIVMNMDAHRPWFMKEPRFCVLLPVWRDVLEIPVYIHIQRNPLEVAHSLKARSGIPIRAGLALWETYNVRALEASAGLPRLFVSFEDLMQDPVSTVESLHAALVEQKIHGLRVPTEPELTLFLDEELYRQRRSTKSLRAVATASQLSLYHLLQSGQDDPDAVVAPTLTAKCIETLRKYEQTIDVDSRVERAHARQQQRSGTNLELQLALKNLELKHTLASIREASGKVRMLERKIEQLQQVAGEVKTNLALSDQKVSMLEQGKVVLERERAGLQQVNAELEQGKAVLERERAGLQQVNAELEQGKAVLERERAGLQQVNAELEQGKAVLERERAGLQQVNAELEQGKAVLERERAGLQQVNAELEQGKAVLERERAGLQQVNAELEQGKAVLERERAGLQQVNAELEQGKAVLERERAGLQQVNAGLEQGKAVLERERAGLQQVNAELEQGKAVLERERAGLQQVNAELEQGKAVLERERAGLQQVNAELEQGKAVLERERAGLQQVNAELEQGKAVLERERAGLQQVNAELEQGKAVLERERAGLQQVNAELEQSQVSLQGVKEELQSHVQDAVGEASNRRAKIQETVKRWDLELTDNKERIDKLNQTVGRLRGGLDAILNSRWWRFGDIFSSSICRLSFQNLPITARDRLLEAVAEYQTRRHVLREFATSQESALDDLAHRVPSQTRAVDKILRSGPNRNADLTKMLFERGLARKRRESQIEELTEFIEALIVVFETVIHSRRWRLGNYVLSLPRKYLLKKAPIAAANSVLELINKYRVDERSSTAQAPATRQKRQLGFSADGECKINLPADVPDRTPVATAGDLIRPTAVPLLSSTRVDIVVCVHNALDHVERCLSSVLRATNLDYRLIVVNDGSNAETTASLRRLSAQRSAVQLIETNGPLGYTRAANRGLRASTAATVVLLNSDTIVSRLWLEGMLECMESGEELGMVGPLSNAASWQSIPERFDERGGWAVNDLPSGYNVDEFSELVYRASECQFPRVDFLNGFCLMIERKVIEKIGYLDEATFPRGYGEENDYCLRARSAGFELAIADHCFVYHAKSRSFGSSARTRLAKEGRDALRAKYDFELIERGTEQLKNSAVLNRLRSRVKSLLDETNWIRKPSTPGESVLRGGGTPRGILFVLPVKGGSGGANSVIQEAAGMRYLGVDARVAVDAKHADGIREFYGGLLNSESALVVFSSSDDLLNKAEPFDVIVATLWSTPALIEPIAKRWSDKLFGYYVQDYEPWFFPGDPERQSIAFGSYTLLPGMTLMAKTDWICRTVMERHGKEVYRVTPSLDRSVYHPGAVPRSSGEVITVVAMIRPRTPRRAPLRTLRVLREVASTAAGYMRAVFFGCDTKEMYSHVQKHDENFRFDFEFESRGILTRYDVADLLRSADIFVDFSDYQAFGRTGLEAMACGCAVVLPARGGVYEYAVDGENACVVDTSSFDDMTATLAQLIEDSALREKLQRCGSDSASNYSIIRASLSELSVFRLVWSLKRAGQDSCAAAFRRGHEPIVDDTDVVSITVLLGVNAGHGGADDNVQQRILRPLRHSSLEKKVAVREAHSLGDLREGPPDICVVHNGVFGTASQAKEIVSLCQRAGVKLIYESDEHSASLLRSGESNAVEILGRGSDRVVVPAASFRSTFEDLNRDVHVVPAALDETLWLEQRVLGERVLCERRGEDVIQVLFVGSEAELNLMFPAWRDLIGKTERQLMLLAVGGFASEFGHCCEVIARPEKDYEHFVRFLRSRNQWDIAILPVDESSIDADFRFLGYAALGLTIVCSNRGRHTTFARHEENALLVDNNQSDWRDALTRVTTDLSLRESLRMQALYDVETKYSLNRRATDYYKAYVGVYETMQ